MSRLGARLIIFAVWSISSSPRQLPVILVQLCIIRYQLTVAKGQCLDPRHLCSYNFNDILYARTKRLDTL